MKIRWITASAVAAVALAGFSTPVSQAQSRGNSDNATIGVSDIDHAGAATATQTFRHAKYARTPAGIAARHKAQVLPLSQPSAESTVIADNAFTQNPGDLTFQGGPVVEFAASHPIYFTNNETCTIAACWGHPEKFLRDLSESEFIHVVDQYVRLYAPQRYTVGFHTRYNAKLAKKLFTSDLLAVLHAVVASTREAGYRHIYHLFLPPRVDTCFDPPFDNQCYSPDNPSTFVFCAYHGSIDFGDLNQHVLFSVEPSQAVPGCNNAPGSPNGELIDSTNDTLSHELFETITDPDGDAFWNRSSLSLFGQEIGDECHFLNPATLTISEPTFHINGNLYRVQSEYSNQRHACAIAPGRN